MADPTEEYYCYICNSTTTIEPAVGYTDGEDLRCLRCRKPGFVERRAVRPTPPSRPVINNTLPAALHRLLPPSLTGNNPMIIPPPNNAPFNALSFPFSRSTDANAQIGLPIQQIVNSVLQHLGNPQNSNISIQGDGDLANIGQRLFESIAQSLEGNQGLDQILQIIVDQDVNRYGSPPTAQRVIAALVPEILDEERARALDQCTICHEEYAANDQVHRLTSDATQCPHIFHRDCIIPWLEQHNTCPVCRFELPTDDETYNQGIGQLRNQLQESLNRTNNNQTSSNMASSAIPSSVPSTSNTSVNPLASTSTPSQAGTYSASVPFNVPNTPMSSSIPSTSNISSTSPTTAATGVSEPTASSSTSTEPSNSSTVPPTSNTQAPTNPIFNIAFGTPPNMPPNAFGAFASGTIDPQQIHSQAQAAAQGLLQQFFGQMPNQANSNFNPQRFMMQSQPFVFQMPVPDGQSNTNTNTTTNPNTSQNEQPSTQQVPSQQQTQNANQRCRQQ